MLFSVSKAPISSFLKRILAFIIFNSAFGQLIMYSFVTFFLLFFDFYILGFSHFSLVFSVSVASFIVNIKKLNVNIDH